MKRRLRNLWIGLRDTTLFFTLLMWLCVLPFVLLLTVPFFGWQGGVIGAIITFVAALIGCYIICAYPQISSRRN